MKVEDMIGRAKQNIENEDNWHPYDTIANPLMVGDFVVVGWNNLGPLVGKVLEIQKGGILTSEGLTLTKTRVVCDFTYHTGPKDKGAHLIRCVVKTVNPLSQPLVEAIASMNLPVRS